MKISNFLNVYSAIGAVVIALYLFTPINELLKETKYNRTVSILMIIIFVSLTAYGGYKEITSASHSGIGMSPHEYTAHPVYQEFIAHVTNT